MNIFSKYTLIGMVTIGLLWPFSASAALVEVTAIDPTRALTTEAAFVGSGGVVNSGNLLGVFEGNDSNQQGDLELWLQTDGGFGAGFMLTEHFKDEYSDASATKSGDWTTNTDIMFYVVKAAKAFALYEVAPAASSGTWSTYDLWVRNYGGNGGLVVSHITGYNPSSVPEPGMMILFGTGLVGLAVVGRSRFK